MGIRRSNSEIKQRLQALQEIAVELMSPRELHETLSLIVKKATSLLVADAASLYIKERESDFFVFEVAVNNSICFPFEKKSIPISDKGLASYVFKTGKVLNLVDVAKIPKDSDYQFDGSFDRRFDYKTRSILTFPLRSSKGEILGVIQVINRKNNREETWPSRDQSALEQMPFFTDEDAALLASFAGIASSALENSMLYKDIENLFEGFVRASVHAIESRDPSTRGHSERVAALTVDLAEKTSRSEDSGIRHIHFGEDQISEIRYAALLHDFGKIGVREATLLKEEKLNPLQKLAIRSRFNEFKHVAEIQVLRGYIERLIKEGRLANELEFARLEKEVQEFGMKIEEAWALVQELNVPSILSQDKTDRLNRMTHTHCTDCEGVHRPMLAQDELFSLSIKRGSLNDQERLEIESHVVHTVEFLKKIPWTQKFARVPEIAGAHHERLTGRGYPNASPEKEIPDQARIMAIADIFDALVASDRPYKPSLPTTRALEILEMQVKSGDLDGRFFKVFVEGKVWETPGFVLHTPEIKKKKIA